jgi:hypothetical protein
MLAEADMAKCFDYPAAGILSMGVGSSPQRLQISEITRGTTLKKVIIEFG